MAASPNGMKFPKRVAAWKTKLAPGRQYPVDEALTLVKEFATAKFPAQHRFRDHRVVGEILELARRYRDEGADELVFYDITASPEGRSVDRSWISRAARHRWPCS